MVDLPALLNAFWLGLVTALATGLGALPVYWFDLSRRGLGLLWGLSAGIMAAISVLELLLPAADALVPLVLGGLAGVAFVLVAAERIHANNDAKARDHDGHDHGDRPAPPHGDPQDPPSGLEGGHHAIGATGLSGLSLLMFLVFTVHSAPEGVGIGSALREGTITGLIVVLAIAVHNIPEGTAVAVGLRADGVPLWKAVVMAITTSLPQPLLAPLVFLVAVGPLLPAGMAFAGGAMLALVAREVVPEGLRASPARFWLGSALGLGLGLLLDWGLRTPAGL